MREQENQINHNLENQLLIDCSQTEITTAKANRIIDVLKQPLDWSYVSENAQRNCVLPLVGWNLIKKFDEFLSAEIKNSLNEYFQKHAQNNMFLTAKLIEVIKLFKSNNVPVLPFKGPLLAMQFYGNVALRSFGDLDVLVQTKQLETAIKLLEQNGYEPLSGINWLKKNNLDITHKDIKFVHKESKVLLELHWKLSNSYFALPLENHRLWNDAETASFGGMKVNNLSFDDLLIYLCLHGGRHGWERLSWICDINEMVSSREDIDWEHINKEAKRLGCEKALGLGLHLINEFFGRKTPVLEWQRNKNGELFEELTQQIRARLFNDDPNFVEISNRAWFLEEQLFQLKLREGLWDKLKLYVHHNNIYLKQIFSPNKADEELMQLPSWLAPIYYITRPARLFYTYVVKFKKSKYSKN
jgi:hypothetical protein